ncbi:hypothetical protein NOVA_29030 [Nocardia nova]|uniref:hypothetical protein n=1 Tax=Nocardia nova TaxID=37330 RepID=UPI001C496BB3|nr:hypothetical protein [Nocardia nova]MBV7706837.1 hypothetical protein [Nocardia nova]
MVSGLDAAAGLPRGHHDDRGALTALLVETRCRLHGVPRKAPPPLVWLGRCYHAFAAMGLASAVLYQQYVPVPEECWPMAEECKSICDDLGHALGERLARKYALDEGTSARAHGDAMMAWDGPDLPGCLEQMRALSAAIRQICERIAADTAVLPDQRKAAARAARTANFIWTQYM